jgi:hypothetical protein
VGVPPAERRILRRGLPDGGGRARTSGRSFRRDARTGGQDAHLPETRPRPNGVSLVPKAGINRETGLRSTKDTKSTKGQVVAAPDANFHKYPDDFSEERNDGILPNYEIFHRHLHSVIWSNSVIPFPPTGWFFVKDGMTRSPTG